MYAEMQNHEENIIKDRWPRKTKNLQCKDSSDARKHFLNPRDKDADVSDLSLKETVREVSYRNVN